MSSTGPISLSHHSRFKAPPRKWTAAEIDYLRAHAGTIGHREIAAHLGRPVKSISSFAKRSGLVTRTFWTDAEREFVRAHQGKMTARQIAQKLNRGVSAIHVCISKLGLAGKPIPRLLDEKALAFLRQKNAEGWSDAEVATALGMPGKRRNVCQARRRLGLPDNAFSAHRIERIREKTREQLEKAGLSSLAQVRVAAFQEFARRSGWPEDLRPRAVQILNVLAERGPMTRREIADAIGMPWKGSRKSLVSNDPEGSYLAHLHKRGLVIVLRRAVKKPGAGRGSSVHVYSLPLTIERKVS